MRYIALWTSATGKKFKELHAKLQIAQSAARKLATKYKIKQWHAAYWAKYGGMSSVQFKEGVVPDEKIWKKSKDDNGFWEPRCNCKEGKAIDKEIKALPQISREETNACIGCCGERFKTKFQRRNPALTPNPMLWDVFLKIRVGKN